MRRVALRLVVDAVLVAGLSFASAGTLAWSRAWALTIVMFVTRALGTAMAYRANPDLVRERAGLPVHADQSRTDRALVLGVLATGFLGLPAVAGLDRFHWHLLPVPPTIISDAGLVGFALGWALKALVLRANAFATAAVRLQGAHEVVDTGPYRVVRHPFYAADPLIFVGLSLWLESYAAAFLSVVPIALMVSRLVLEERFLRDALPDYGRYAQRVRYRIIPGVW